MNLIEVLSGALAWGIVVYLIYRLYNKRRVKPKGWKILIVFWIGMFSFSFNFNLFGEAVRLSILPLGVWILYFILNSKEGRWEIYRRFAWLGFGANFIFLLFSLISTPVHQAIYPQNEIDTYIAGVEEAYFITIHPSGQDVSLKKDTLLDGIERLQKSTISSDDWYYDLTRNDSKEVNERFPYQLVNATPKWGSGSQAIIYLEDDGKGLLILTPEKQRYFRSDQSLLEEGNE
ncbi:hypothetical protein GH754_07685 [Salinibacillus xinjiangensis]|uniref:Uncharacterized protein n=1 Tax=Salinibacillus xinjiangensis TaxID=1229268 RepID=A0A6G1X5M2_9BACI|nr:hypothetical protein [Salinibacillus xinjiangensis]